MAIKKEIITELLDKAKTGKDIFNEGGLIKQLTKQLAEGILESKISRPLLF